MAYHTEQEMREMLCDHRKMNIDRYMQEHSEGFMLLTTDGSNIKEVFFRTEAASRKATEKYKGTPLSEVFQIVAPIPGDSKAARRSTSDLERRVTEHVTLCPKDKTELILDGPIAWYTDEVGADDVWAEEAVCPDCGYRVLRKPSDERINAIGPGLREQIFD